MKSSVFKRSERLIKNLETLLLNLRNKNKNYKYKRIYRYFLNKKYYPEKNISDDLINSLKNEKFKIQKDSIVENLLEQILSAIYNNSISENVFSGSDNKNVHNCLNFVKDNFTESEYLVYLNLKDLILNLDLNIFDNELRKKIDDERFIRLIHKFIRELEFAPENSYSKTLSGNKLSDLIINIYLQPVDRILENKDLNWTRYREALLIGLCEENELDLITHAINKLYKIKVCPVIKTKGQKLNYLEYEIKHGNRIYLRVPQNIIKNFILKKDLVKDIDEKPWKSKHRGYLLNLEDERIFKIYNIELKNLYLYYSQADNVSRKFSQLKHLMETSCLKTLARKHRTSMRKIKQRFKIQDSWGIKKPFYKGFKKRLPVKSNYIDYISPVERNKYKS